MKGEAPFRQMVYVHRNTDKIHITPWEQWEDLAKRRLVRTGFPSKIAITIFAANPEIESQEFSERPKGESTGSDESRLLPESTPPESNMMDKSSDSNDDDHYRGPAFRALSKEDQALFVGKSTRMLDILDLRKWHICCVSRGIVQS